MSSNTQKTKEMKILRQLSWKYRKSLTQRTIVFYYYYWGEKNGEIYDVTIDCLVPITSKFSSFC